MPDFLRKLEREIADVQRSAGMRGQVRVSAVDLLHLIDDYKRIDATLRSNAYLQQAAPPERVLQEVIRACKSSMSKEQFYELLFAFVAGENDREAKTSYERRAINATIR